MTRAAAANGWSLTNEAFEADRTTISSKENDNFYHEISDEEALVTPNMEKVFDFGPSLMDEVFTALDRKKERPLSRRRESSGSEADDGKVSPTRQRPALKPTTFVKQISNEDAKMLDTAINIANTIANKKLENKDNDDSPFTPRRRFPFSFRGNNSPKTERKTFISEICTKRAQQFTDDMLSEQEREAYKVLVEGPFKKCEKFASKTLQSPRSKMKKVEKPRSLNNTLERRCSKTEEKEEVRTPPIPPRKIQPGSNYKTHRRKYPLLEDTAPPLPEAPPPPLNFRKHSLSDEDSDHIEVFSSKSPSPQNPTDNTKWNFPGKSLNALVLTDAKRKENGDNSSDSSKTSGMCSRNSSTGSNFRYSAEELGVYNNEDYFWSEQLSLDELRGGGDTTNRDSSSSHGSLKALKDRDHHVSREDLSYFALDNPTSRTRRSIARAQGIESDEVRIMSKVFCNQISSDTCIVALDETNWQVHQAIKYVKLQQLLEMEIGSVEQCKHALWQANWDVSAATTDLLVSPSADTWLSLEPPVYV